MASPLVRIGALACVLLLASAAGAVTTYVGSARLNAATVDGCRINDHGQLAVAAGPQGPVSFHFRGILNDVHGTARDAVWDAATLLPLGFFCRFGELAEHLDVREVIVDCAFARVEAGNAFFETLQLTTGGEPCA